MIQQYSTSKITCDAKGCGSNERRSGLVDMRVIAGFISWTHVDGKDSCPRCSREADPGGKGK